MKIILFLIGITILSCKGQISNNSIIEQGNFINKNNDRINTYYIYDFVLKENVRKHGYQSKYSKGSVTTNFYFSHNGNIPSQELRNTENLSEAYKLIGEYSYYIKYVYNKDQLGEIKFVDCSQIPKDDFCLDN